MTERGKKTTKTRTNQRKKENRKKRYEGIP